MAEFVELGALLAAYDGDGEAVKAQLVGLDTWELRALERAAELLALMCADEVDAR